MGKIKKILAMGLISMVSLSFVGCKMIAKTPEAIQNETIAKVGDKKITKGDLDKLMESKYQQYEQQYGKDYMSNPQVKAQVEQEKKMMLDSLVNRDVVIGMGEKEKWIPSDSEINKEVDKNFNEMKNNLKKAYGIKDDKQFNELLKSSGYADEAAYKKELSQQVIYNSILTKHVFNNINVTEADAKKYYDTNKEKFTVQPGADVYQIITKDKKDIEKAEKELKDGEKFSKVAEKYNIDGTKTTGGSLGYIPYNSTQYVKEFMDAVKKLKKDGEVSQPVKSQFGYHIIKVEGIKTKAQVQPFDKVKDQIMKQLKGQKQETAYTDTIKKWKDELGVKIYEDKLNK